MKISLLDISRRYDASKVSQYGIQAYGEQNDYPQRVMEIIASSVTGGSCCKVYRSFIAGKGFRDAGLYQTTINQDGQTMDELLELLSADLSTFNGFALHLNYNANYAITSVHFVPFENVRLGMPSEDTGRITNVKLHPDWGKRNTNVRKWRKEDIVAIDLFDPTPSAIDAQVEAAGGWPQYKGQVYYYSGAGKNTYPLPIFDAALTDMSTEEAISDITNRNACNGFLPAGMIVDVCQDSMPIATHADGTPKDPEPNGTELAIQSVQGSKNAAKIMYAQVATREEIPEFVKFDGANYDKEFSVSRDAAKDMIGRAFNQPPILRGENVGAGFGAEIMQQAYNFYNSVTTGERLLIERVMTEIFKLYIMPIQADFTIDPLTYEVEISLSERLGERLAAFNELLNSATPLSQKRAIAKVLYGLQDEEVDAIFPLTQNPSQQ